MPDHELTRMPHAQNDVGGEANRSRRVDYYLCRVTGRVVLDKTGLEGDYNFTLDWSATAENPVGNLLSGLPEQLGLTLHSQTAPVAVLLIDQIERPANNSPEAQ